MTSFVTRFDFRAPGADATARRELYGRALDQAAYVDEHEQGALMLSQHHATDDGYLPSPLLAAAAMAARTRRIPITVSALLVNMYEPVKLAEDVAVLDHLSGGRVSYTFGLGYRREEYDLFGKSWKTRGQDIEQAIRLLVALWSGSEVVHEGRAVRIDPVPLTRPHPFLFYGGGSPAAARRAARLGLGFQPQVADPRLREIYEDWCRTLGWEPGFVLMPPPGPYTVVCADDPDAFWAEYGEYLLADAMAYRAWAGDRDSVVRDDSTTVEELRAGDRYVVLDPDDLVAHCRDRRIRVVTSHPLCAGLPAEPSWESLRLICEKVMPALRTIPTPTPTSGPQE